MSLLLGGIGFATAAITERRQALAIRPYHAELIYRLAGAEALAGNRAGATNTDSLRTWRITVASRISRSRA